MSKRARKSKLLQVRMTPAEFAVMHQWAKQQKTTVSKVVRGAVVQAMANDLAAVWPGQKA